MTHPNHEEWMAFLYGETDRPDRSRLRDHLNDCATCRKRVEAWRATLKDLDAFKTGAPLPGSAPVRALFVPPLVKWGLAAVFMLGLGFGAGQFAGARQPDRHQLQQTVVSAAREQFRAELGADLQAALGPDEREATNDFRRALRTMFTGWAARQENSSRAQMEQLIGNLARTIVSARTEDRQTVLALLRELERQNLTAFALLKKNLETVAVVADNRFQQTETQLGQLISYAEPDAE